jgi:hypothetical protein
MSNRNLEALSERERACLAHLQEAKRLGVSFSQYCREKEQSMHQWTWIKQALVRKGVIGARRRSERTKAAGFAPVGRDAAGSVRAACAVCVHRSSLDLSKQRLSGVHRGPPALKAGTLPNMVFRRSNRGHPHSRATYCPNNNFPFSDEINRTVL